MFEWRRGRIKRHIKFGKRDCGRRTASRGFTLIEMVVVLGITIMLMGAMSVYKGIGTDQIAFFTEGSKVTQTILQAKSYGITSWLVQDSHIAVCGYGFHRENDTVFEVVRYYLRDADCPNLDDPKTSVDDWDIGYFAQLPISSARLTQGLSFKNDLDSNRNIGDIFFAPPDPKIYFFQYNPNSPGVILRSSTGSIQITDGKSTMKIVVGQGGQITYKIQ